MGLLDLIGWIIIGLVAGWLASIVMGRGGYGLIGDIVVGLIGALIGGFLASQLRLNGLSSDDPLNWWSLILAVIGAIIFIGLLRAVSSSRTGA
jgi:uncharacterized membrane protein YeaQ/YmgE (transglycosylase-associated protein family)